MQTSCDPEGCAEHVRWTRHYHHFSCFVFPYPQVFVLCPRSGRSWWFSNWTRGFCEAVGTKGWKHSHSPLSWSSAQALLVLSSLCPADNNLSEIQICLGSPLALKSPLPLISCLHLTSSHTQHILTGAISPSPSSWSHMRWEGKHPNSCGTLKQLVFGCAVIDASLNTQMDLSNSRVWGQSLTVVSRKWKSNRSFISEFVRNRTEVLGTWLDWSNLAISWFLLLIFLTILANSTA